MTTIVISMGLMIGVFNIVMVTLDYCYNRKHAKDVMVLKKEFQTKME